jgi:uncharacterized membrane-anchored protein
MRCPRRDDASLRLQRTVAGLSVAAISYHALMLLSYPVKALAYEVHGFDSMLAIGIVVSVIAVPVWLTLGTIRRRIEGN